MKKKLVQAMIVFGMSMTVLGTAIPCMADTSDAATQTETTSEDASDETTYESSEITENTDEASEDTTEESDFVEGSALLSDYDYAKGELSEEGWKSDFLKMEYVPEDGITMGVDENSKMDEYYGRNGEDKKVADSEMVALDENSGYVQMTVEVNPNRESEEDILDRFKENEELELTGKNKEMTIGGKTFLTTTGVVDKERYMVGVCTDEDDIAIAIKVKYKDTTARKTLLKGFAEVKEETEDDAESEEKTVEAENADTENADDETETVEETTEETATEAAK